METNHTAIVIRNPMNARFLNVGQEDRVLLETDCDHRSCAKVSIVISSASFLLSAFCAGMAYGLMTSQDHKDGKVVSSYKYLPDHVSSTQLAMGFIACSIISAISGIILCNKFRNRNL